MSIETNGRTPVRQASAVGSNNQWGDNGDVCRCLSTCAVDRNVGRVCLQLHVSGMGLDALSYSTSLMIKTREGYVIVHFLVCKMPNSQRISARPYAASTITQSWALLHRGREGFSFSVLPEGQELLPSYCACTFRSDLEASLRCSPLLRERSVVE